MALQKKDSKQGKLSQEERIRLFQKPERITSIVGTACDRETVASQATDRSVKGFNFVLI